MDAINGWRAQRMVGNMGGDLPWLEYTTVGFAHVQVLDSGAAYGLSLWDDHFFVCNITFGDPANAKFYAVTIVSDDDSGRKADGNGFWIKEPGQPFRRATVCLNPAQPNNKGTIAHELGHALGLNHPAFITNNVYGPCSNTGYDSIMAYNYLPWSTQWPASLLPTREDARGPWVCNIANAGGLAYIYSISPDYGFGALNADTDGDGCADVEESGPTPSLGGDRDPANPWDFYDVPVPALIVNPAGTRDKAIGTTTDVTALLKYVGLTTSQLAYYVDLDGNGQWDGLQYDRTRSADPAKPWRSGPPDGGIGITSDVIAMNAQVGHSCAAPP